MQTILFTYVQTRADSQWREAFVQISLRELQRRRGPFGAPTGDATHWPSGEGLEWFGLRGVASAARAERPTLRRDCYPTRTLPRYPSRLAKSYGDE